MKDQYNKTQLSPDKEMGRHVFHRDQFAHYFRWSHVLNKAKRGMAILDVGCGSGNLLEVFYRNMYAPKAYVGVDVRKRTITIANEKWARLKWAKFLCVDAVKSSLPYDCLYDMIVCFEVLEHVGKRNVPKVLKNIHKCMAKNTVLLLSTPVFDPKVGAAGNHMIDGEVGELGFGELKKLLVKHFKITNVWGTFASQRDYKHIMTESQRDVFDALRKYYDTHLLSNIMAPLFPEKSRNCLWECIRK